jgi:hypothetical protein
MKEVLAEGMEVYLGDCRDMLPALPIVDLVVTIRAAASIYFFQWRRPIFSRLSQRHAFAYWNANFINLGLVHKDGEVIEYWNPIIRDLRGAMWRLFGWYVWDQGDGLPGDWAGRLAPSHEFIFHFNRNGLKPNKTKQAISVKRNPSGGGLRKSSGEITERTGADHQSKKIPDSVIRVYREIVTFWPRGRASGTISDWSA